MCTTMPNEVSHSCNDSISQEEMTGHTTNGQCDGCNAVEFLSHLELDILLFFFCIHLKFKLEICSSVMCTSVE